MRVPIASYPKRDYALTMAKELSSLVLDRERLDLALEASRLGEYEWDFGLNLFRVSPRMQEITGMAAGAYSITNPDHLWEIIHPEDRAAARHAIESAIDTNGRYDIDHRVLRPDDGRVIWVRATGVLVHDIQGRRVAVCGLIGDISARRAAEEQRITLMAELDHRVKNVLAAVQALAQQTAKRTTSMSNFLSTFSGRLKAMASANELLTAARWRGAAIAQLAEAELSGIAPGQTKWEGPDLFLTPRAANALSLALHELATNALKFGALSTETGQVSLTWAAESDGGFGLTWSESGGPTVTAPPQLGFGSTLLRQVTGRELNGDVEVEFRASGVHVHLRAAAAAIAERLEPPTDSPRRGPLELAPVIAGSSDLRGARVLIVEDAVLLALELETGLSEAGAVVIGPAYELEEAIALLGQPIDVAVLDANLNGRAVTPVAQALADAGVPFVFATGYGEAAGAPSGFDAPVIRKPYDVSQVVSAVAALLAR